MMLTNFGFFVDVPLAQLGVTGTGFDVAATFFEGLLSFGSPCVLPLVPGYLSFISGVSVAKLNAQSGDKPVTIGWNDTIKVMPPILSFIAGFTAVFIAIFGLVAFITTLAGQDIKVWIQLIAGAAVIIMGLHFLGVFRIGFLNMEKRFHFNSATKPAGLVGAFLVGCAFAAGWSPCVGPLLGSAMTKALNNEDALGGIGLMLVYCAGLGIPFMLAGLFMTRLLGFIATVKRHYRVIEFAAGLLLIIVGILIITNNMTEITRQLGRLQQG
jgi:cytochrome c-type biogenesis protein